MWTSLRSIVEDKIVADQVDNHVRTFSRFDEAWGGLKWLLSRDPMPKEAKSSIRNGIVYWLYRQAADPLANTPSIAVIYTFDQNQVNFHGIEVFEADKDG